MKAKIGTSFGLVLLLAIGVIATMLALGLFNSAKVAASHLPVQIASGFITITPDTPGDTATYKISFRNPHELTAGSGRLYIKIDKNIGVPSTIEKERITISASGGGVSNPQLDPEITEDTSGNPVVIITIGDTDPNTTGTQSLDAYAEPAASGSFLEAAGQTTNTNSGHVLRFSRLAGLTNASTPSTDSPTWIRMSDDGVNYGTPRNITVLRWLDSSAGSGARGTVITMTGKAWSSGRTATVFLDKNSNGRLDADEVTLAQSDASISGGSFTASVTIDTNFSVGANTISAIDGSGFFAPMDIATWNPITNPRHGGQGFSVTGSISVVPTSATRGETVTISLADYGGADGQGTITEIRFGGVEADISRITRTYTNNAGDFSVEVPATAPLGTQKVEVLDTAEDSSRPGKTATIELTGLILAVSPTTAVANQTITVSGSGFSGGGTVDADTITVGGVKAVHSAIAIDDSGNLVSSFSLPSGDGAAPGNDDNGTLRTAGSHEVRITDTAGRIGTVSVTVPPRTLTLAPTESRRSSIVSVVGSGFSASKTVTITHGTTTVATITADSSGNINSTFTVPSGAGIPSTNTITATIGDPSTGAQRTATATHKVPGAYITITPTSVASGETLTVTGVNFPGFSSLTTLAIGEVSAIPLPAPATDGSGNFTTTVLVPPLASGTQTLLITAGKISANLPITIVAPAAVPVVTSNATEDTFADEITADNLMRVWWFNNADQTWAFFDPRPAFSAANTFTEATSGDIVWVNVTKQTTFQGATLYAGWNLISLD